MRILMISDVYAPRVNGVSTSISIFRSELKKQDHHTILIAPDYSGGKYLHTDKEGVIRVPSLKIPFDPEDRLMRIRFVKKALEQINPNTIDVLHIQTPFIAHRLGVEWAKKHKIPVVETYHTFFEEYFYHYIPFIPKKWLKALARRLTVSQCQKLDSLVIPSSPMQEMLRSYGVGCPSRIIPTGIELHKFEKGDGDHFRKEHGIPLDRPVLVHVGRIAYEKNIGFLFDVLKVLKNRNADILMIIAGEGPALSSLKEKASSLGIEENVRFVGYLSRNSALLDCYSAGDAFVFSSRTETQGLVLLDAMALGVPVVSTAKLGTKDVLRDGEGCMIAEEDVVDFSEKLFRLLSDKQLRSELSSKAKKYVNEWSAPAMGLRMSDFYQEICRVMQEIQTGSEMNEQTANEY